MEFRVLGDTRHGQRGAAVARDVALGARAHVLADGAHDHLLAARRPQQCGDDLLGGRVRRSLLKVSHNRFT